MIDKKLFVLTFSAIAYLLLVQIQLARADERPNQELILQVPAPPLTFTCSTLDASENQMQSLHLHQTFVDNFTTEPLSTSLWQTYYYNDRDKLSGRTLPSNSEKEIYVDQNYIGNGYLPLGINPFRIQNGILSIIAKRTPQELRSKLYNFPFTSGVINTLNSFKQKYGYFEIRARLPRGKGLWPAFWLLQPNEWPPEIDILEAMDGDHPNYISMTTHWRDGGKGEHKMSACNVDVSNADTAFHTYGVFWDKDRIVYYVDRKPVIKLATPPGLDLPMYILANLAVESIADDTTPTSSSYDIDWITAYQQ
jgi:beta-glucanase (GH16 family)